MHKVTGYQIAAARSLLNMSQNDLAVLAKLDVLSLVQIEELSETTLVTSAGALNTVAVLECMGVVFGEANGVGQGVWFEGEYW